MYNSGPASTPRNLKKEQRENKEKNLVKIRSGNEFYMLLQRISPKVNT